MVSVEVVARCIMPVELFCCFLCVAPNVCFRQIGLAC